MFAVLVFACFAAFVLTQHLKHTPTVVQRFRHTPYFSPTPAGHVKEARISFRIANTDHVTVTVVDMGGADVATLARDLELPRYTTLSLRWNGRRGAISYPAQSRSSGLLIDALEHGRAAPDGDYRIRVELLGQKRTVYSPWSVRLVRHSAAGGR